MRLFLYQSYQFPSQCPATETLMEKVGRCNLTGRRHMVSDQMRERFSNTIRRITEFAYAEQRRLNNWRNSKSGDAKDPRLADLERIILTDVHFCEAFILRGSLSAQRRLMLSNNDILDRQSNEHLHLGPTKIKFLMDELDYRNGIKVQFWTMKCPIGVYPMLYSLKAGGMQSSNTFKPLVLGFRFAHQHCIDDCED